ncbi:MAG: hypothetical protein KGS61_18290 [Verrucomicrobia bacterium]|nr:hypothetical protein [Verrucomicrobiota bacterium]
MSGDEYFARLKQTLEGVIGNLRARGIHERHFSLVWSKRVSSANARIC